MQKPDGRWFDSIVATFEELERAWAAEAPLPRENGTVEAVIVRRRPGEHERVDRAEVSTADGIAGDHWATGPRKLEAQVTLMLVRVAALVAGPDGNPADAGDNLLVDLDLGEANLPAGARLRVGSALLEVTAKPHTGCKKFSARFGDDALRWVNAPARRGERLRGIHARVIEAGTIAPGDAIVVVSR